MRIRRSPNRWSCLPASFATAIDADLDWLLGLVGHDGSEIVWPDLPEPLRRRAFHIQEIVDVLWWLGLSVTRFEARPTSAPGPGEVPHALGADPHVRMTGIMRGQVGVITGRTWGGSPHAVAWDGTQCLDPGGMTYGLENFQVGSFWAIRST